MTKQFRTLDDVDVKGKRVLLRVDLNVPMENGRVTDTTRLERVAPTITELSAKRFEQPHSLSYHDITRTRLPFITLVWSMWKVEECGSWLKSIETLGCVV